MAFKRIDPQLINRLAADLEPAMLDAFLASVNQIKDRVKVGEVEKAIRRGDIDEAVRLIGFDPLDLRPLVRSIGATFEAGGIATAKAIEKAAPKASQLVIRFDARNPRAETWIGQRSATLVTQIVDDQTNMLRTAMLNGIEKGNGPRTIALDLVGRINKTTGNREGGLIGLTSRQEQWQRNYLSELSSDDPKILRRALSRGLRDKRYDAAIKRAIRDGKPLDAATRNKLITTYRNRSLRYRGETIARTETLEALNTGNREAYQQAVDSGSIRAEAVKRFVRTAGDERVRHEHALIPAMNTDGVGLNNYFATPDGPYINAPFGVQCRCYVETRVDFLAGVL